MSHSPDTPSPPGDTIRDWMEEHGVDTHTMARNLGICPVTMGKLLDGHVAINHWLAQSLSVATGIPSEFWIARERTYRERLNKKS